MRNSLKRAAALAFAVLMLLTLVPASLAEEIASAPQTQTSEWVVPGISDGGALVDSLSAAEEEPAADELDAVYTVHFDIGDEAVSAGVSAPDDVQVEAGQTLGTLPVVEWKNAAGEAVKVFAGWYTDAGLTDEFDRASVINADRTLYAKWVEPNDPDRYYVNFYSQDGTTVLLTVSVEENRTVSAAAAPSLEGKIFRGWAKDKQGDRPLSELDAFDFSVPVSDAVSGGNTLNLYAWYGNEVSVAFVTNGGTAAATQYIAEGETAVSPVTTRTGFAFRGWSTDPATYTAFSFDTPITTDITLYAFWDAQMVPVTLVYMHENPDDDGYTPAGYSQTVYAPAGSYLSIEKSTITRIGQNHNIRYSETAGGALTGNASTAQSGGTIATIPDVHETYFQYDSATNSRYVMPDGSTVALVYYKRALVTLTFNYELSSDGSIDVDGHISAADQAKYKVSYTKTTTTSTWSSYDGFTYSFTAKYGENIVPVWPQVGWVDTDGNFYGWQKPDSNIVQVSNVYTLVNDLFGTPSITDGKLTASGTLPAKELNTTTYWLIYARTTLPGEMADFSYNGSNYTIYSEACQMAKAGQYFGYKALEGCTPVSGKPEFGKKYESINDSMDVKPVDSTMKEKFDAVFPDKIESSDRCQVLLYDRSPLTLTIIAYDDIYGSMPQTASYLYGDWIYNKDTDTLKQVEAKMRKANYRFAGWYTDANFTPGTEYKPDENSRIMANMNLYGKWEPNQFLAEYYLYTDDASPYATQGFAEGGRIDDKLVPAAVQSQFVGWYWYQNGRLERFDFSSTVGAAHVDGEDKLKLYAVWKGTTGKVSYLPGEGGDNATQEVFDSRDFEINAASVELPAYENVWKDGSVPADSSLTFVGWKAPNGAVYQPGRYVPVTRQLMQFEAQWSEDAVKLIYNANGGEGSDVTEIWARNSAVNIWDNKDAGNPHFTRENYELIGWDENPSATEPTYKLGTGTIKLTDDITTLYAIWKRTVTDVTIAKQVTGNMGDRSKEFAFMVKSTEAMGAGETYTLSADAKTARFTLSHGQSVTLKDVPIGAVLTISESNAAGYTMTVSPNNGEGASTSYTVGSADETITVTNHKDGYPDTGVLLDSLPYALILAAVVIAAVIVIVRRRRHRDDD